MDWETVVKTVGISGILIAVIGFVLRSLFKQLLSLDMVNHQHELEIEKERFKSEFQKATIEHQTRFSALHVKRAEVIAELYSLLYQAERDSTRLISYQESQDNFLTADKYNDAYTSYKSLSEYFEPNRIYFSPIICEKITNITKLLLVAPIHASPFPPDIKPGQPLFDVWVKTFEQTRDGINSLKLDIENEFRKLLGITPDKTN